MITWPACMLTEDEARSRGEEGEGERECRPLAERPREPAVRVADGVGGQSGGVEDPGGEHEHGSVGEARQAQAHQDVAPHRPEEDPVIGPWPEVGSGARPSTGCRPDAAGVRTGQAGVHVDRMGHDGRSRDPRGKQHALRSSNRGLVPLARPPTSRPAGGVSTAKPAMITAGSPAVAISKRRWPFPRVVIRVSGRSVR
ncbi:hypothetical protein V3664_27335 [Streptomyces sp. CS62]